MVAKPYKLVIFGATGFGGKLAAEYLIDNYQDKISYALAARNSEKLNALRTRYDGLQVPTIVVDATNFQDLLRLCEQTELIATTVGPYTKYGELLLRACCETGTHYIDITGEVLWAREMTERYQASAKETGAQITQFCGFDSIPSDVGVFHLQQESLARFGVPCSNVHLTVGPAKGGFSGGTIASIVATLDKVKEHKLEKNDINNPYLLCRLERQRTSSHAPPAPYIDPYSKKWQAPFLMAAVNVPVVHRTNQLLNDRYGLDFTYSESVETTSRWSAYGITLGLAAAHFCLKSPTLRSLAIGSLFPCPGVGPSEELLRDGFFTLYLRGTTASGATLRERISCESEPGYTASAKMLIESAICQLEQSYTKPGFWTPAAAFGQHLLLRLTSPSAGFTFELEVEQP